MENIEDMKLESCIIGEVRDKECAEKILREATKGYTNSIPSIMSQSLENKVKDLMKILRE